MRKGRWITGALLAAAVVTAAALTVLVLGIERGRAPSVVLFLGRFHPMVVHFPIALLLLAVLLEELSRWWPGAAQARPAAPLVLLLGAASALAAAVLGYLLSLDGGYEASLLSLHLWLGLAVAGVAAALALASMRATPPGRLYRAALYGLAVLVLAAGHLGGNLSRGSGYLTHHLPAPLKQLVGLDTGAPAGLLADVDSALVFADVVQPILERRCVACHGPGRSKGGLLLDTPEGLTAGGRDGAVLVAGQPAQSELVRRITLPPYDEEAMPPEGGALDVGETEVIRWWIAHGASFDLRVGDVPDRPSSVETYLARIAAPRRPARSGIYALDVPAADTAAVAALVRAGLLVTHVAPDAPYLRVSATGLHGRLTDADLERLAPVALQVARLDVGHTPVTDRAAATFARMPHLTHLHLERTGVTDRTLAQLAGLRHLEYLNLYGTAVTDAGLRHLGGLASLRAVYLWQTAVTPAGVAALRAALPGVEVLTGLTLAAADSSGTHP